MNSINSQQRKYLKAQAHDKKPVVTIGNNGLTEAVTTELIQALDHHELIKLKLPAGEKVARQQLLDQACNQAKAILVTLIGRTGVLFKQAKDSRYTLPK